MSELLLAAAMGFAILLGGVLWFAVATLLGTAAASALVAACVGFIAGMAVGTRQSANGVRTPDEEPRDV